jgi:hypothetical protein
LCRIVPAAVKSTRKVSFSFRRVKQGEWTGFCRQERLPDVNSASKVAVSKSTRILLPVNVMIAIKASGTYEFSQDKYNIK